MFIIKRSERDSNPCGVAAKRFSRPPRYDRFDIAPSYLIKKQDLRTTLKLMFRVRRSARYILSKCPIHVKHVFKFFLIFFNFLFLHNNNYRIITIYLRGFSGFLCILRIFKKHYVFIVLSLFFYIFLLIFLHFLRPKSFSALYLFHFFQEKLHSHVCTLLLLLH